MLHGVPIIRERSLTYLSIPDHFDRSKGYEYIGLFEEDGHLDTFFLLYYPHEIGPRADDMTVREPSALLHLTHNRKGPYRKKNESGFDINYTTLLIHVIKHFEEQGVFTHWSLVPIDTYTRIPSEHNKPYIDAIRYRYTDRVAFPIESMQLREEPNAYFINKFIAFGRKYPVKMEAWVASLKDEYRPQLPAL